MADSEAENLENLGLIGHSYDSLFQIRKRIRSIQDISLPTRRGISTDQAGVAFLVLILAVITNGFVVVPVMRALFGHGDIRVTFVWVLGWPLLAGWGVARPMPYAKTVKGTITTWVRAALDDPGHLRGVPVAAPPVPDGVRRLHYVREWVAGEEYSPLIGERDATTVGVERRFAGDGVKLDDWLRDQFRTNIEAHDGEHAQDFTPESGSRRRVATVIMDVEKD